MLAAQLCVVWVIISAWLQQSLQHEATLLGGAAATHAAMALVPSADGVR